MMTSNEELLIESQRIMTNIYVFFKTNITIQCCILIFLEHKFRVIETVISCNGFFFLAVVALFS